jgi:hypothetical protein
MPIIECECKDCRGTGLYAGMGERDGAAVVCHCCKGTGKDKITYTEFTGRKDRVGVTRVFETNPGICVGGLDLSEFGGMPIKEWESGLPFPKGSEMRKYVCPSW